jgi:protein-disulfide isomerase
MRLSKREILMLLAALAGLVLSGLSGAAQYVPWLGSWCAAFSGGCRETASFSMLAAPLWSWGGAFYVMLVFALLASREWVDWLIPLGVGVEITLVAVMWALKAACVFCLANAVVVLLLSVLFLAGRAVSWRALALALAALVVSAAVIGRENGMIARLCPPQTLVVRGAPTPEGAPKAPDVGVISLAGSQAKGPADAPVTVIEYSDFRCPACRKVHPVVEEAMKLYGPKVRWVFKNFPLPMHKDAQIASEGALCAADQGRFWDYQDALFGFGGEFNPETLTQVASELKLDSKTFRACLDAGTHKEGVEREVREGVLAGINAVPTFIVNGKISSGSLPLKELKALIDEALALAAAK